jgi:hypothetical protein
MSSLVLACVALLLTYVWLAPSIHPYVIKEQEGSLLNPVLELTDSQALADFNSKYVFFLLYYAHAYQLHNPPLSSATPRMNIKLDGVSYRAEIVGGVIRVGKGPFSDVDLTITSSRKEIIRILRNTSLLSASFAEGKSSLTPEASRATLFSKGYLRLYDSLYDSSITGNVIRIVGS